MVRRLRHVIYIDRNPLNPDEGWGWIEVGLEDAAQFGVPTQLPQRRRVTRQQKLRPLQQDEASETDATIQTYTELLKFPSRGRASGRKFVLIMRDKQFTINAQKSLTIKAICAWVKTWADPETTILTPGNRAISLEGETASHQPHFVYFILNSDGNAIKIGRAKNLENRLKALQTSSPAPLKLIRFIQVSSSQRAKELEQGLHRRFYSLRLAGEWFKAEGELLEYIEQIKYEDAFKG